jgi:hypothetical protein
MFCQPYKSAVPEGVGGFMTKAEQAAVWSSISEEAISHANG